VLGGVCGEADEGGRVAGCPVVIRCLSPGPPVHSQARSSRSVKRIRVRVAVESGVKCASMCLGRPEATLNRSTSSYTSSPHLARLPLTDSFHPISFSSENAERQAQNDPRSRGSFCSLNAVSFLLHKLHQAVQNEMMDRTVDIIALSALPPSFIEWFQIQSGGNMPRCVVSSHACRSKGHELGQLNSRFGIAKSGESCPPVEPHLSGAVPQQAAK